MKYYCGSNQGKKKYFLGLQEQLKKKKTTNQTVKPWVLSSCLILVLYPEKIVSISCSPCLDAISEEAFYTKWL